MNVFIEMPSGARSRGYDRDEDWSDWFDKVVAQVRDFGIAGSSVVAMNEIDEEAARVSF